MTGDLSQCSVRLSLQTFCLDYHIKRSLGCILGCLVSSMLNVPVLIFSVSHSVLYHDHSCLSWFRRLMVNRFRITVFLVTLGSLPSRQYRKVCELIFFYERFHPQSKILSPTVCKTEVSCVLRSTHISYTTSVSSPQESWLTYFEREYDAANVPLLWPLTLAAFPLQDVYSCPWLRCYTAVNAIHLFQSLAGVSI